MHPLGRDAAVAAIAAGQHGVITRAQLVAGGLGRRAIEHRIARGRLHRLHRGVYAVGHLALAPRAREHAAVLAYGSGAVLSFLAAGGLWVLGTGESPIVDVTVAARNPGRRPGIRVHRVAALDPRDVGVVHGIPITAPARTLLDLGGILPGHRLRRAFDEAQVRRLTTRAELHAACERAPRHRGIAAVRALLEENNEPVLTRSEAEERLLALIDAGELPRPEVNVHIAGHEVDFLWRGQGLVVEVDGFAFHSGRAAFERDRRRDADLGATGLRVVRVTWRRIVGEPEALLVRLAQALAA